MSAPTHVPQGSLGPTGQPIDQGTQPVFTAGTTGSNVSADTTRQLLQAGATLYTQEAPPACFICSEEWLNPKGGAHAAIQFRAQVWKRITSGPTRVAHPRCLSTAHSLIHRTKFTAPGDVSGTWRRGCYMPHPSITVRQSRGGRGNGVCAVSGVPLASPGSFFSFNTDPTHWYTWAATEEVCSQKLLDFRESKALEGTAEKVPWATSTSTPVNCSPTFVSAGKQVNIGSYRISPPFNDIHGATENLWQDGNELLEEETWTKVQAELEQESDDGKEDWEIV